MPSNPKTGAAAALDEVTTDRTPTPAGLGAPLTPGPTEGPLSPGPGPGSGPIPGGGADPGSGPGPVPGTGTGTGSGTSADGGTQAGAQSGSDAGFDTRVADTFLSLIQNATSPDALEAQNIILRRIALQGDVVPSRVPPPANITEIGGYVNLLGTLNQTDMQAQVLAGILGVAGPNPPLGWLTTAPSLSFVTLTNDRPPGAAQPTLPITVAIRSDFADALRAAITALHERGCTLPLLTTPAALPRPASTSVVPTDPLPYLGRVLLLASNTALTSPATDPLVRARTSGSGDPFGVAARVLQPGSVGVDPADYDALQATPSAVVTVAVPSARLVFIAPLLAGAGFYPSSPTPPTSGSDNAWARLINVTGLVTGQTVLGDELSQLYSWADIADSAFAAQLTARWNGTTFTVPT